MDRWYIPGEEVKSDIMDQTVIPGQRVRVTQIIQIVHEVRIEDVSDESGITVKEAIQDIPGNRTITRILDRSGIYDNLEVEDISVVEVEIL